MKRNLLILGSAVVLLTGMVFVSACSKEKPKTIQKEAVPVAVGRVIQKTVPVQIKTIGNVEAYSTVAIKSQVSGELTEVHFREGQDVNKGDMLFTIDPRPYEALLRQAEAALTRDIAQTENAREEERRYAELARKGYVAQSQYEQIKTSAAALGSVVNADKALVENARLQLSYCFIRSPITGRTGSLMSHKGNIIKANADSPMVVINQIQPVYVNFSVPEKYTIDIKKYMAEGRLKVEASVSKEGPPVQGILTFIDNTVDTATGTIRLKGTFSNEKKQLWPGRFVDVVLTLTTRPNVIAVPLQAVQTGQNGQYVFLVKPDLTVEIMPVVVSMTLDGEAIVEKGLKPDDTVVTDGHLRLTQGAKAEIKGSTEGGKQ